MSSNEFALPIIRLTYGEGSPGKAACWMSALSVFMGEPWTDQLSCVDPAINRFCIFINDYFGLGRSADEARSRTILPILFDVVGTAGNLLEAERRRFILIDAGIRTWLPGILDWLNLSDEANEFRVMLEIVDLEGLKAAMAKVNRVLRLARALDRILGHAHALTLDLAFTLTLDHIALDHIARARARARALARALALARDFSLALDARERFITEQCLPVLRRMIEAGPHAQEEDLTPSCSREHFLQRVGVNQ